MLRVCFCASGPGNLVKVEGIMKTEQYIHILLGSVKQSAENLDLVPNWTYQQDNDPKHTTKVLKNGSRITTWRFYNGQAKAET